MNHGKTRPMVRLLALLGALPAGEALAADGCVKDANTNYQIGQTAEIEVTNGDPPGKIVREGSAIGDGSVVARCTGDVILDSSYLGVRPDGLVPLTVGGRDSGFGIEIYLAENGGAGPTYTFPQQYPRSFGHGGFIRSDDVVVGYRVKRTEGPVHFGRVDQMKVAEQTATALTGGFTPAFRHMRIYEMRFIRPSCSISAEALDQTVSMGSYSLADFKNPDRATPWVNFKLKVSECKDPIGLVAQFTFGSTTDADPLAKDLFRMFSGGPTHVGLEIANEAKRTITPGRPYEANALATDENFEFYVRLRESVPNVGGGAFVRPVTIRVDFL